MNDQQLTFAIAGAGSSQTGLVLQRLQERAGQWVPMPELVEFCGGYAVHSRIADLRKLGYAIDNLVDRSSKPYRSYYRIIT